MFPAHQLKNNLRFVNGPHSMFLPMASAAFRGASRRFMVLEVALVTMNQRADSE